jgi:hypothetical protein
MATPKLNVRVGLTRISKPLYPSEPGYVESVNRQMKVVEETVLDIIEQFERATPEIMLEAIRPAFELSKVYCPKDTRALVNSAYLEITSYRGKPRVEMGYARGGNPRYAAIVHENLEFRHAYPTQAKFLERAVLEWSGDIYYNLGRGYMDFMG